MAPVSTIGETGLKPAVLSGGEREVAKKERKTQSALLLPPQQSPPHPPRQALQRAGHLITEAPLAAPDAEKLSDSL